MLAKSIGVPIPIPADALMLATSARVVTGKFVLAHAFVALLFALVVGADAVHTGTKDRAQCSLSLWKIPGPDTTPPGISYCTIEKRGMVAIGLAVLTPGVRSVAVIGSGLAGIPLRQFLPGLLMGSGLFLSLHFFLGCWWRAAGGIMSPTLAIVGIVILLAVGLGIWVIIRKRQMPNASNREVLEQAVGAWHEATCPVWLALGAADRLQIRLDIEHHHAHG